MIAAAFVTPCLNAAPLLYASEGRGTTAGNQGASVPESKSSQSLKCWRPYKLQVSFCLCSTSTSCLSIRQAKLPTRMASPFQPNEKPFLLLSNKVHQQPTLALFLPPFSKALSPHYQWQRITLAPRFSYKAGCIFVAHGWGASSAGVGKMQPAGRIWPAKPFAPTLSPSCQSEIWGWGSVQSHFEQRMTSHTPLPPGPN